MKSFLVVSPRNKRWVVGWLPAGGTAKSTTMQPVVCSSSLEQQRGQVKAAASLQSFPLETGTSGNAESGADEEDVEQAVSKVSCVVLRWGG